MMPPVDKGNNKYKMLVGDEVNKQPKQMTKPSALERKLNAIFGMIKWSVRNVRKAKGRSRYAGILKRPTFPSELLRDGIGKKVLNATCELLKPNLSMAGINMNSIITNDASRVRSKMPPKMRDLFIKVAKWLGIKLTPEALLTRAIEANFLDGVCKGMCQAFICQLKGENAQMSIKELQNHANLESNTAKLQGFHFLEVKIQNTAYYRQEILAELNKDSSNMTPQQVCKKLGFKAKFAADLDENRDKAKVQLRKLLREGIKLLEEVKEAVEEIVGKAEAVEFNLTLEGTEWTDEINEMQNILLDDDYSKPILIEMNQKKGLGHTILADPASNRLFDPNTGWYEYDTKQKMATALLKMITKSYPEYATGTIKFITHD